MSMGKGGGTTVTTAELSPEQREQIASQTDFFTGTIKPVYQQAVLGAQSLYNQTAPGATYAAQNLARTAGQVGSTVGETGESALRTGITGLESLFGTDYEQQQLAAALAPAQAQYQTNLAALQAGFGGAGQLGSARQALAQTQLAQGAMGAQQQAAAGVLKDITSQRAGAAQTLAQLGQTGLGQALTAAGTQVTAAESPQELYNKYASIIFGTPSSSYNPNFAGTQGTTSTENTSKWGFSL